MVLPKTPKDGVTISLHEGTTETGILGKTLFLFTVTTCQILQ